jgi:hypothetical protein
MSELIAGTMVGREHLVMLCGTIDPVQFPSQRAIHDHLCAKHVRSELPKHLLRLGLIEPGFYWCFLEFQNGSRRQGGGEATQQAHFHWIVQLTPGARYGDVFWAMKEFWDRQRPDDAGEVPAGRPALGRIDKVKPIENVEGMARYFTAYFGDVRKKGIPDWYIERCNEGHYLRLASHALGMVPCARREVDRQRELKGEVKKRKLRTIGQRITWCGTEAMLFEHRTTIDVEGEIVHEDFKFLGDLVPDYLWLWETESGQRFEQDRDGQLVERSPDGFFEVDDAVVQFAFLKGWIRPREPVRGKKAE